MKISIITVCFNSVATIDDTIRSVLAQDFPNVEYIVIDGGSKDGTQEVIEGYGDRISKFICEKDQGIYDAMNKGIRNATGDVVGILNSDDFFYRSSSLREVAESFSPEIDAVYADLVYVKRNNPREISRLSTSSGFSPWKMRFGFMIPHPTFYVRRHLFEKFGYYKLNYRVAADFELMARFFSQGIAATRLDSVLVAMREGGISSNGFWWRVHQNVEIARACRENNILTVLPLLAVKIPFKLLSFTKRHIDPPSWDWNLSTPSS